MAWLFLLFVLVPLAELYVIIQVASVIGGWETIALLVVESLVGAWLVKRQGLATLDKISVALAQNRVPARELVDGFLIMMAGALMLVPGFIGDLIAFGLLIPPTRMAVRALVLRRLADGRGIGFFTQTASGGARFVGTFRAGSVIDTSGGASASQGPSERELGQ